MKTIQRHAVVALTVAVQCGLPGRRLCRARGYQQVKEIVR